MPYNLIFTTKFNDSSILITIISWDYLNLTLANEYIGDVTIPTQVTEYNKKNSRRISQSDCSIHIKLNYFCITTFQNSAFNEMKIIYYTVGTVPKFNRKVIETE